MPILLSARAKLLAIFVYLFVQVVGSLSCTIRVVQELEASSTSNQMATEEHYPYAQGFDTACTHAYDGPSAFRF